MQNNRTGSTGSEDELRQRATSQTHLQQLELLIAANDGRNGASNKSGRSPCDLLAEHLEAARRCLLGNMMHEYEMNLKQALTALDCIPGKTDRANARMAINILRKQKDDRSAVRGTA